MTVHAGDVVFSRASPAGTGMVVPGDVMHIERDGPGEMTVHIHARTGCKTPIEGMATADPPSGKAQEDGFAG